MSQECPTPDLALLVQRRVDAVSARDIDAAMGFYAPHAVYDTSPFGLGRFDGPVAIRGFFEEWWGTYEQSEVALEEIRDLGDGVAFCVLVVRGRLPGAPGWVQLRYASVEQWGDGLVERITNYPDIDEARAAAERLVKERA
jgi:ketosteroid isomerase-like protein